MSLRRSPTGGVIRRACVGRASPFVVELSEAEREELEARVRRHRAEQRVALRARMILMAATGEENVAIARILRVAPNTMLKWRKRFCCERLAGLADRPRSGRPPLFAPEVLAHVNAVACERPAA